MTRRARREGRDPDALLDRLDTFAEGFSQESRGALIQLLTSGGVDIMRNPPEAPRPTWRAATASP